MYDSFETQPLHAETAKPTVWWKRAQNVRYMFFCLVITVLILIGLASFTIYYVVDTENSSASKSNDDSDDTDDDDADANTCVTPACVELANEILSWMDISVDPCTDFFGYSCGGFQELYEHKLVQYPQWTVEWGTVAVMGERQRNLFLTNVIYEPDASLAGHSSVQAAQTFFHSCFESTLDEEDITGTNLLLEFQSIINIDTAGDLSKDSEWNDENMDAFQNSIAWLAQRDWNDLFFVDVYTTNTPIVYQAYSQWVNYNHTLWQQMMADTFIAEYQTFFQLNASQAESVAQLVLEFTQAVADITTANNDYGGWNFLATYAETINFQAFVNQTLFGESPILNYTNILLKTFDCNMEDIAELVYVDMGIAFFNNLTTLVAETPPFVIQYWLFTDVLYHFFDYKYSLTQSRMIDRQQFCYDLTRVRFPFLYAHVIIHAEYPLSKQNMVQALTDDIIHSGLVDLLEDGTQSWIDDESRAAMIQKGESVNTFVGVPDAIRDIANMDAYYGQIQFSQQNESFIDNYELILEFAAAQKRLSFLGAAAVDFVDDWPDFFRNEAIWPNWLTGISAFYVASTVGDDRGNYFAIPALITQKPFFDDASADDVRPASMNYGAIGFVIGHEISHGFDPSGSHYDWEGTYSTNVWSNATRAHYNDVKMQCYIDEYNNIEINDGIFVNGANAITENVADNAGVEESWHAYMNYYESTLSALATDTERDAFVSWRLPGLQNITRQHLFWIAMAQTRCDVWRDDYYRDPPSYYNSHSPRKARVVGVVTNMKGFANAFECPADSPMNPSEKCHLWIE